MTESQRGATALEMAIVAPVLFALVFGLFALAMRGFTGAMVQHAARETAREMSLHDVEPSLAAATARAGEELPSFIEDGFASGSVSGTRDPGTTVTVELTYDVAWLGRIAAVVPGLDAGDFAAVTRSASARRE